MKIFKISKIFLALVYTGCKCVGSGQEKQKTQRPLRKENMEAEIKITEVLLKHARVLRKSPDPEEAIAAAKWEIRFEDELEQLRKRTAKAERATAGRT